MTTKRPPLVLVTWEDAKVLDDSAWAANKDHDYKAMIFESVGFLLSDTPEGVILTSAWSEDMVAARDQIPRGMIVKVRKLKA
jgi:hypothetical protein